MIPCRFTPVPESYPLEGLMSGAVRTWAAASLVPTSIDATAIAIQTIARIVPTLLKQEWSPLRSLWPFCKTWQIGFAHGAGDLGGRCDWYRVTVGTRGWLGAGCSQ